MVVSKINNAGYRLIELLKELIKHPLSMEELLEIVEDTSDNSYRKELINKYLNTLKLLNLPIIKQKDNKYYIQRSIDPIDFNENDLSLIKLIESSLPHIQSKELKENLVSALDVIEKNFSDSTLDLISQKTIKPYIEDFQLGLYGENIKKFEKYCKDKLKLTIRYKNESTGETEKYNVAPIKIVYKSNNAAIICYYYETNSYKEFLLKNITEAHQTPQVSTINLAGSVTFKLKNRLASSYRLKEGECVIEQGVDYIIVSNNLEDKDLILKRLIRYFDNCEILYPKTMKDKMLRLIEDMESMYV